MSASLELPAEPRSVRVAREWVAAELRSIGRDDLRHPATLGVSELVTNALLHAGPPIMVRLGGTADHPRIEVHDGSVAPPTLRDMTHNGRALATVGRGLGIVGTCSHTWGAELSGSGKVVWFEPTVDDDAAIRHMPGAMFHFEQHDRPPPAPGHDPRSLVHVQLLGLPTKLYTHYRIWFEEIRRELRLLALTHREEYPLAVELSDLTLEVERQRGEASGLERLDATIGAGAPYVDLDFFVSPAAAAAVARLLDLLEQVDEFCRSQRLLTPPPGPDVVELRRWYHHEFERQARGEPPLPWAERPSRVPS